MTTSFPQALIKCSDSHSGNQKTGCSLHRSIRDGLSDQLSDSGHSQCYAVNPLFVSHISSRCSPAHCALCVSSFAHLDHHWLSSIRNQLPLMLVILTHSLFACNLPVSCCCPYLLASWSTMDLTCLASYSLPRTTTLEKEQTGRTSYSTHCITENHPALFPCFVLQTSKPTFFSHLHAL